jgi:hypothetical protein
VKWQSVVATQKLGKRSPDWADRPVPAARRLVKEPTTAHKTPVGIKLAQGTTILHTPPSDLNSANCQTSHHQLGPKDSMCLGRRPVDWLWRIPMVDASVSCQRARGRIRLHKVQSVPHCTTIWHRVCIIWTLKLEVAVVANGGPRLAVSCCSHALLGR